MHRIEPPFGPEFQVWPVVSFELTDTTSVPHRTDGHAVIDPGKLKELQVMILCAQTIAW